MTTEQEIPTKELDQSIEQLNESRQLDDDQGELLCEKPREISSLESDVQEVKSPVTSDVDDEDDEKDDEVTMDNGKDDEEDEKEDEEDEKEDEDDDKDEEVDKEDGRKVRRKQIDEDDESEDEDDESEDEEGEKGGDGGGKKVRRKQIDEDDESEDEEGEKEGEEDGEKVRKKQKDDGKEDEEDESEDEEDEKEDQEDDEKDEEDEDDDDDDRDRRPPINAPIYDFDIMMAKKKEENSRKRKRMNYDIINDNDDIIADIINQMKDAVEADSEANKNKMAATRKLKLLPFVISQLRKVDLRDAFLDSDVLSVITEWLAPLPDRSLPHLNIRESLLKILIDFNLHDIDRIKGSGIGKAIMYLYKHPKETKENKQRAKQLISCWSRPIFQLDSSFHSISREEREQRDLELMSKQRRVSKQNDSFESEGPGPSSGPKKKEEVAQKPGDKGWIGRARVPAPSMKDYVIRPRSKVDGDIGKSSKRPSNMLEKYMKSQQERRRASRQQRAINMKIDRV